MNYLRDAITYIQRQPPLPPQPPATNEIQIPQFVKDNAYLTASIALAVFMRPRGLAFGAASALVLQLISNETILFQHKPLVDRFLTVIKPVLDQPMSPTVTIALSALMMFEDLSFLSTWWIGLTATLLVLPNNNERQA